MKKACIVCLFFIFIMILFAQNLDEKQKQLEELNELIEKENKIIQEAEREKQKTEKNMLTTKQKKKQAENKITNLKRTEKKTKAELDDLIDDLHSTASEYEKLNYYCKNEFTQLAVTHYQSELFPEKKIDCRFLAKLIRRTAEEIILLDDKIGDLESKKEKTNKEYENVIWSRIVEKKKSDEFKDQLTFLNKNITKCEHQKQKALRRKTRLEDEAAALDDLITKLQSNIISDKFSYEFSTPKLIWPITGKILRKFGEQKSDKYRVSFFNDGIDIGTEEGKEVVAVENGVVAYARWYNGAGKLVIIDHKNGFYTLYSHNSKILVSKGDVVKKNQLISLAGKTGSVDEPCLHFELRKRGTPVDPLDYLE